MNDQVDHKAQQDISEGGAIDDLNVSEVPETFEVKEVIDTFLHRILDVEDCAKEYIVAAVKAYNDKAGKLKDDVKRNQKKLEDERDETIRVLTVKELRKTIREIERHNRSSPVTTLEKSLFISLFSVFDKFVGDLVGVLYSKNPELYKNINKEISLSEALKYESMSELRQVF